MTRDTQSLLLSREDARRSFGRNKAGCPGYVVSTACVLELLAIPPAKTPNRRCAAISFCTPGLEIKGWVRGIEKSWLSMKTSARRED